MEIYQEFGNDVQLTAAGDLRTVVGTQLADQRIIRRLLTNALDYIWQPTYGAGLPEFIGELDTPAIYEKIKGLITSQMLAESAVSQSPAPVITLTGLPSALSGTITYTEKLTNTQVVVSFSYPRS